MRLTKKEDGADPGVSVVVGFILIIAISILGLTLYQQNAVPKQEKAAEIQHHRNVIDQLQVFQSAVAQAANGESASATFKPGLTYGSPSSIFVHSPPSAGKVQVQSYETIGVSTDGDPQDESNNIIIQNAEGVGGSSTFWGGQDVGDTGDGDGFQYTSSYFNYAPQYYHFQDAPRTRLEYGLLFKDYKESVGGNQIPINNQRMFSQENIRLTMITGDVNTAQVSQMNLRVVPISASENSISVTNSGNNQYVRIQVPSKLPAKKWRQLLAEQSCDPQDTDELSDTNNGNEIVGNCQSKKSTGGHLVDIQELGRGDTNGDGFTDQYYLEFVMERGVVYDLNMAKLFVTTEGSTSQVPTAPSLYASWAGNNDITIRESSSISVPGQALDIYNNPVDGEEVVAEAVDVRGGGTWPDDCYGGYESADQRADGNEQLQNDQDNDGVVRCDNGNSNNQQFYQRGLEASENNGDFTFVYLAPNVGNDVDIELRVCLQKYLDTGDKNQVNANQCSGINQRTVNQ